MTIPKVYKGYTITKVGSSALNGNKDITRVVIPDTIIGSQAFYNCTNLTSVSFPSSLKSIDGSAFAKTNLDALTLPATITNVGGRAFAEIASLASVTVQGKTVFGSGVFSTCPNLTTVVFQDSLRELPSGRCKNSWQLHFQKMCIA